MTWRLRARPVVAVVVLASLGALLFGAGSAAGAASNPPITVTYTGTFSEDFGAYSTVAAPGVPGFCGSRNTADMFWTMTATTTADDLANSVPVYWKVSTIGGSLSYKWDATPTCVALFGTTFSNDDCTAALTLRPGYQARDFGRLDIVSYLYTPLIGVYPRTPWSGDFLQSDHSSGQCSVGLGALYKPAPSGTDPDAVPFRDAWLPRLESPPGPPVSKDYANTYHYDNPPGGNFGTVKVASTLTLTTRYPELRIDQLTHSDQIDITDTGATVAVGEHVVLHVRSATTGTTLDATSPRWSGIADPNALVAYSIHDADEASTMSVTRVKPGHFDGQQSISFYFVRPGDYTVTVTASSGGQQQSPVSTTIHAVGPTATFTAKTCRLGINSTVMVPRRTSRLQYGANNVCPTAAGIEWKATMLPPAGYGGQMAMSQLVRGQITRGPQVCFAATSWQSDTSAFYTPSLLIVRKGRIVGLLGGEPTLTLGNLPRPWGGSDAPAVTLKGTRPHTIVLRFRDYLMYRANRPGSIWVAIREMDWFVSGSATRHGSRWVVTNARSSARSLGSTASHHPPEWTQVARAGGCPR